MLFWYVFDLLDDFREIKNSDIGQIEVQKDRTWKQFDILGEIRVVCDHKSKLKQLPARGRHGPKW